MYLFNIRVYGILLDDQNQVLISDERTQSVSFTKFPGGGLEYGEGLLDALKREFLEECNLKIEIVKHLYTTDFYEKSSFNESQIISIYYIVKPLETMNIEIKQKVFDFDYSIKNIGNNKLEAFRLVNINNLKPEEFTFRTDQRAWQEFQNMLECK